ISPELNEVTGRSGDSRESGSYSNNKNLERDGPAFTYPAGVTSGPLLSSDAVAIDDTMTFERAQLIPYYILERPVGSRGDISSSSLYVVDNTTGGGWWYVVLSRAFDTGHEDDSIFTLGGDYVFGVSVFNNGGGNSHAAHYYFCFGSNHR
ncbi:MAG: ethylbenzene dehydrogenase-related protein, partial [Anaerolineae bacterium]|nr:ethylbenzene dehydrogenase-related protein [Anaerolineae bacterium]